MVNGGKRLKKKLDDQVNKILEPCRETKTYIWQRDTELQKKKEFCGGLCSQPTSIYIAVKYGTAV